MSFFFQAEDGIRDGHVTGVQTCALPISSPPVPLSLRERGYDASIFVPRQVLTPCPPLPLGEGVRRVDLRSPSGPHPLSPSPFGRGGTTGRSSFPVRSSPQIGRASCRE